MSAPQFDADMPAVGTREHCDRCGKTVWLRSAGTIGLSPTHPSGTRVFQWFARKGARPRPAHCPVSDGWPVTYHEVGGRRIFHLPPLDPRRTVC